MTYLEENLLKIQDLSNKAYDKAIDPDIIEYLDTILTLIKNIEDDLNLSYEEE